VVLVSEHHQQLVLMLRVLIQHPQGVLSRAHDWLLRLLLIVWCGAGIARGKTATIATLRCVLFEVVHVPRPPCTQQRLLMVHTQLAFVAALGMCVSMEESSMCICSNNHDALIAHCHKEEEEFPSSSSATTTVVVWRALLQHWRVLHSADTTTTIADDDTDDIINTVATNNNNNASVATVAVARDRCVDSEIAIDSCGRKGIEIWFFRIPRERFLKHLG